MILRGGAIALWLLACCGLGNGQSALDDATRGYELASWDSNPAVRLDPKSAAAAYNRGLAFRRKGDNDHAISEFSAAIRLDPKYADAFGARGNAYADKGDKDRAIADFNEAIRLNPTDALTFHNRGLTYAAKDDDDRAIADYDEAIRLEPKFADAYDARGLAYKAKGHLERAIADYGEAIGLNPQSSSAYFDRGRAYLHGGSPAQAQADFKQANKLDPQYPYAVLWLDLAERRNNIPSHLAQAAKQLDMKAWPAPVVRLFLGDMSPAQTLAAADVKDRKMKQAQVCEANFYSGELALLQSAKEEALRLFRLAASDCPHDFSEWDGANTELKALGAAP